MSEEMQEDFGSHLRGIRKSKGLSLDDLANESKISRAYIWKLEMGKSNPSLSVVMRLANALGVSPSIMVDFVGEDERKCETCVYWASSPPSEQHGRCSKIRPGPDYERDDNAYLRPDPQCKRDDNVKSYLVTRRYFFCADWG